MTLLRQWILSSVDGSGHTQDIGGGGFTGTVMPTYPGDCPVIGRGPCHAVPVGMMFDGSNDYVDVGLAHTVTNVFSLCAWIYPLDLNRRSVYSAGNTTFTPTFGVGILNGAGQLEVTTPGYYFDITAAGVIVANKWQHIAYSRGGTAKNLRWLYLNGAKMPQDTTLTHTQDLDMWAGSSAATLGCRAPGGQQWNGGLADVRVYDSALTDQQVYDIYKVSLRENALLLAGAL